MKPPTQSMEWSEAVRIDGSRERDRFVESHLDLVRYVALRVASRLPSVVELDDLVHDGVLGLLDALQKYDAGRGVRFRTYAERRVRGAILDGLRQKDWQSRAVRRGRRELEETMARLTTLHGRDPSEEELAEAMGLELAELHQLLRDASTGPILPLDDLAGQAVGETQGDTGQPHVVLERRQLLEALAEELVRLPQREQRVLELYYHEGLNMKEVGAVLGVTESRVCQLHSQAGARLCGVLTSRLHPSNQPVLAGKGR